jgi:hypothetical protein
MNLKSLHSPQMVVVLTPWLDPTQDRPLLESFESVKPLLKKLDQVQADLIGQQVSNTGPSDALKALQAKESDTDAQHDRKLKGLGLVLEGLSLLCDQEAQRTAYEGVHRRLLPDGLSAIRQSYMTEAGNASMAEGRLTIGDRGLLAATPLPQGLVHLEKQFQEYLTAGRQLGELERQKGHVLALPAGVTAADVGKVRGAWIKLVNALLVNLATETLTPEQEERILGPLQRVLLQASTRSVAPGDPVAPSAMSTSSATAVTAPNPVVKPKGSATDDEDETTVISVKP